VPSSAKNASGVLDSSCALVRQTAAQANKQQAAQQQAEQSAASTHQIHDGVQLSVLFQRFKRFGVAHS
jgi:hypothetical protein